MALISPRASQQDKEASNRRESFQKGKRELEGKMFPGGQKSQSVKPALEAPDDEPSIEMVPTGESREHKVYAASKQQRALAQSDGPGATAAALGAMSRFSPFSGAAKSKK